VARRRSRAGAHRTAGAQRGAARRLAALSGLISLDSLAQAIRERFGGTVGEGNVAAAQAAHAWVADELRELSGAAAG